MYAPWEHYPKTLTHAEMQNPLSVVEDFFSAAGVMEHRGELKVWRDFAVSDQYFKDKIHGPGSVTFTYDLNLKLLEAAYLLLLNYRETSWKKEKTTEGQLEDEKEKWVYFPKKLSVEELLNPYSAIKNIFKKIKPQAYRDHLHDWLHGALYNHPMDEATTPGEVVTVYENLKKLYDACWLIYQRETTETEFKGSPNGLPAIDFSGRKFEIRGIRHDSTGAEKLALDSIRQLIVERFSSVQLIVHLGTHRNPFVFFLVILISDAERKPEVELSNKIEDHCKYLGNVHTIVHKSESAKSGIEESNRFWTSVIKQGDLLYKSPDFEVLKPNEIANKVLLERSVFHWERWGKQGKEFLDGAAFYISKSNYVLAAFLLHHVVESTLKALIQSIIGYRVQTHNLSRMLRLSLLLSDDPTNEFVLNTPEGEIHFALLQSAYSQSRYSSSFNPDEASVSALMATVRHFYYLSEEMQRQFIERKKNDNK